MRTIYLSPHLDDATFSCGGLIWEQARKEKGIEIWTVCAGDPPEGPLSAYADLLHVQWSTGREAAGTRRLEDVAACRDLGAAHRHLPFQDCIYRRSKDGAWLYDAEALNEKPAPQDDWLIDSLAQFLDLSLHADDRVVCPLAIGSHVDHQLTRRAAEMLKRPLVFYADLPYVLQSPSAMMEYTIDMQAEKWKVGQEGLEAWTTAAAEYRSQISSFWASEKVMKEQIRAYGVDGVSLWAPIDC